MATTVLALFKDAGEAEAAVRALRSAHFESARLGIVHAGDAHVPRFGWYAFIGSVAGTVGGALLGLLAGVLLAGVLPGWSAMLSGGWFAVLMLVLGGAATGIVAGLLISQSIARQGSLYYEEEASAGRTLVSVHAEQDLVEVARRILLDEGAFEAAPLDTPTTKAS